VGLVDGLTGQVAATYRYDPYGNLLAAEGPAAAVCNYRFAGMFFVPETGMNSAVKRDELNGVWLSRDPIAEAGGVNLYPYCGGDPVNRTDANGLSWLEDAWDAAAGGLQASPVGGVITLGTMAATGSWTPSQAQQHQVARGVAKTAGAMVVSTVKIAVLPPAISGMEASQAQQQDYQGLRAHGVPENYASLVTFVHAMPILGQGITSLEELYSGESGYGVDYGRKLTLEDKGGRMTVVVVDFSSSAGIVYGGLNLISPKPLARVPVAENMFQSGPPGDVISVEPVRPFVTAEGRITATPYSDISGTLPEGVQANHLNQNATFKSAIPSEEGLATGMQGNAFTEPGTPHYNFHKSMEGFWNQYRPGGILEGQRPTNAQYGQALQQALEAGGYSPAQAADLAAQAAAQRSAAGLPETAPVPRIPGRINQAKP
jgi:RHS repeat-associated protein